MGRKSELLKDCISLLKGPQTIQAYFWLRCDLVLNGDEFKLCLKNTVFLQFKPCSKAKVEKWTFALIYTMMPLDYFLLIELAGSRHSLVTSSQHSELKGRLWPLTHQALSSVTFSPPVATYNSSQGKNYRS